jgi:DNA-binding GntR family transcriptional regulator
MDSAFIRHLFDIREALEGFLTRQAATVMDDATLVRLRGFSAGFDAAAASGDPAEMVRHNRALHRTIMALTGNAEAMRLLDLHTYLIGALRVRFGYGPGRAAQTGREHAALLRALARRDAEAAGRIHDAHIRHARDDLLRCLADEAAAAA